MVSFLFFGIGGLGLLSAWWIYGGFELLLCAACALAVLPYAWLQDRRRARSRSRMHPDNNFFGLPLLNAIGFDKHGAPVLPGTRKAKRWLRKNVPLRPMTSEELHATERA